MCAVGSREAVWLDVIDHLVPAVPTHLAPDT